MKEIWDKRFSKENFVYGKEPNQFFKHEIEKLTPGKLLLPGDGEGRNAVFAAQLGWDVTCIDFSEEAKNKALKFASEQGVEINYILGDVLSAFPRDIKYDAIALVFLHLAEDEREILHRNVVNSLAPGGRVILESFDRDQLKHNSGGPKETSLLYTLEQIYTDYNQLELDIFSKELVELNEGDKHVGQASVIRLSGILDD